jgi:hypothetical protein
MYLACPARQTTGTEKQDAHRTTYESIVTTKASSTGRQQVDKNPTVERKEEQCNTVNATTEAIVSDMEIDTSKKEKEPPMTTSIGNTPVRADRPADGSNCTPRPDEEPEEKGPTPADLLQNNHSSRRKGNIKPQDVGTRTTSTVPHPTDIASRSENEDTQMDESDTSSTSLAREGRQENIRHSPKRNKK